MAAAGAAGGGGVLGGVALYEFISGPRLVGGLRRSFRSLPEGRRIRLPSSNASVPLIDDRRAILVRNEGVSEIAHETGEDARHVSLIVGRRVPYSRVAETLLTLEGVSNVGFATRDESFTDLWAADDDSPPTLRLLPIVIPQRGFGGPGRGGGDSPRVRVTVTAEGFVIDELRGSDELSDNGVLAPPRHCGVDSPVTICLRDEDDAESDALLDRLDYRTLYNRLSRARALESWAGDWSDAPRLYLRADARIPWEAVVRTADVARFSLERNRYRRDEHFRVATAERDSTMFPVVILMAVPADDDALGQQR